VNSLLEQILDSPTLPEIVDELQARLATERARRERFYAEITEGQKAEFINGRIIMHSPAKVRHLEVRDNLLTLLRLHTRAKRLGWVSGEKALCVFPRNDFEPDVCFFGPDKAAELRPEQLKLPMPDFVAEVLSESTEAMDRGQKFQDYEAHGVREYWIIDPIAEVLEQYVAREGKYQLAQKSGTGEVRSLIVPGFCIPVRAMFDPQVNLETARGFLNPPPA
jgi:Uma2 family endonuclease